MRKPLRGLLLVSCIAISFTPNFDVATVSALFSRGYNVIPVPQEVALKDEDFEFGSGWGLALGSGVKATDVAVESLEDLQCRNVLKH